ncbi:MAG: NADH-quinone oxidoreductase subunit NuoE [Chloroflexi bacterium]|nr:NADH-quinone oxidoreductase subunit NuoE [Chloroflexota bacterium]MBM3175699.1 NADH-quinone oxidoreductase subunit NuoE [Chloroflexota bacterium]
MEELKQKLADILTPNKKDRRHLIALLQQVQHTLGYLSNEAMLAIADFLEIPESTVYGIATFYNQFRFTPLGKHPVKVCMGTACHLAGGKLVLEAMARELDIQVGGITPDHEFSLERVACVGCCALAPVVVVSDSVYPRMTPPKVEEILVTIKPITQEQSGT